MSRSEGLTEENNDLNRSCQVSDVWQDLPSSRPKDYKMSGFHSLEGLLVARNTGQNVQT